MRQKLIMAHTEDDDIKYQLELKATELCLLCHIWRKKIVNIPGNLGHWGPPESRIRAVADLEYKAELDNDLFVSEPDSNEWQDIEEGSDEEMLVDESEGELYETLESMALEAEYRGEDTPDFTYAWAAGGQHEHPTRTGTSSNKRYRVDN